jgi:gluconate 2-dehydrogenase alpha chain
MEPYFEKFEKICGTSGNAGNISGEKLEGGNPFESPRQNAYPTKVQKRQYGGELFAQAALGLGYHPF